MFKTSLSQQKKIAEALVQLNPDVIIMTTPHGLRLDQSHVFLRNYEVDEKLTRFTLGFYSIIYSHASGTAEWDGKWKEFTASVPINMNLTSSIVDHLQKNGNPVEMTILMRPYLISRSPATYKLPIQWGEAITLWFINEAYKTRNRTMPQSMVMGVTGSRQNFGQSFSRNETFSSLE